MATLTNPVIENLCYQPIRRRAGAGSREAEGAVGLKLGSWRGRGRWVCSLAVSWGRSTSLAGRAAGPRPPGEGERGGFGADVCWGRGCGASV